MKAYSGYVNSGKKPDYDKNIIAKFYIESKIPIKKAASMVAAESSVGTWTEVHTRKKALQELAANVFEIKKNIIKVEYPLELFELGNIPQLLSSIAGNIFGMKEVEKLRLLDISFPKKYVQSFKGPKFGISGVRNVLKIKDRPLVGTIIKPKLGLNYKEHAKVAYEAWVGGIDIVKDDENLTNQKFNPFKKRIAETLKMMHKAEKETCEKKAYMPNITSEINEALSRAKFVKDNNGNYIMIDIITTGWAGLQTIRNKDFGLILHAHRAGYAMFARNPKHGMSMPVIVKLSRLIGFDQLHIGTAVGKMSENLQEVLENVKFCKEEIGLKKIFPVCSGGLHPGHIPKLVKYFGNDIVIQAGGGIHGHPKGTKAGATAMRQSVDATMKNIPLKEYAKTHKELNEAIKTWGVA